MVPTTRDGRRAHVPALVAVILTVVGVCALAVGLLRQQPAPPSPPESTPTSSQVAPAPTERETVAPAQRSSKDEISLDYSEPTQVRIPGIDVSSDLVDLGLDAAGVMETPEPVDRAGWFTPSPPPGVHGATVIAGHVTWDQQPSVFFRLGELRPGDVVEVTRRDGVVVEHEVTKVASFRKDDFPTEEVYAQPNRPELRLITCGGEFDEASGRYLDNVIVWATAVDTRGT